MYQSPLKVRKTEKVKNRKDQYRKKQEGKK